RSCRSQQKSDRSELSDPVGGAGRGSGLSRLDGWTPDSRAGCHQQAHYGLDPRDPAKPDPQFCGLPSKAPQIRAADISRIPLLVLQSPPKRVLVSNGSTVESSMLKPVLLILHQEHSSPGRVGQTLAKLGYPLDIRRPRFGDPLPETMDEHAGAAIFGGPQSANDNEDFLRREIDWIGVPLRDKKPYLGICLGAQMLARHLGAPVFPHPQGHAEVGYYPIRPTEAGRKVCADWPDHVYQ